jgi:rod shape-determining protein MreD
VSLQIGVPLFLVAVLLQTAVFSHLRVFGGQPDLIVLLVIAWSILDRDREGIVWAFVGGLFLDLFSGAPIGVSSLALMPMAFVVSLSEAQVYSTNAVLPIILGLGGALSYHVLYLLLIRVFGQESLPWSQAFVYVMLPSVLVDTLLIAPFLGIMGRWYTRLHPRKIRI